MKLKTADDGVRLVHLCPGDGCAICEPAPHVIALNVDGRGLRTGLCRCPWCLRQQTGFACKK
jgi:hypothetical protein